MPEMPLPSAVPSLPSAGTQARPTESETPVTLPLGAAETLRRELLGQWLSRDRLPSLAYPLGAIERSLRAAGRPWTRPVPTPGLQEYRALIEQERFDAMEQSLAALAVFASVIDGEAPFSSLAQPLHSMAIPSLARIDALVVETVLRTERGMETLGTPGRALQALEARYLATPADFDQAAGRGMAEYVAARTAYNAAVRERLAAAPRPVMSASRSGR